MAITRRAVDDDAGVHQPLAGLVDIVDLIGEMAEIAAAIIDFRRAAILRRPVVGQFHLRVLVARCGQVNEGEAARLAVEPLDLLEAEQLEKADGLVEIRDADHRVQIFEQSFLRSSP